MNRESSHWTAAAWVGGVVIILAMVAGGLFLLAWHDAQALLGDSNDFKAVVSGVGLAGRTPVLTFDIMDLNQRTGAFVEWRLWPFRETDYFARVEPTCRPSFNSFQRTAKPD